MKNCVQIASISAVALFLMACASPATRKAEAAGLVQKCAAVGTPVSSAATCLSNAGLNQAGNAVQGKLYFQSCGPYWGWPFMASCGGVIVNANQGFVSAAEAWGQLDGV